MKAFRIEEKMVYDELNYDIIWQANGEDEEIAFLINREDLEFLLEDIKNKLTDKTNEKNTSLFMFS